MPPGGEDFITVAGYQIVNPQYLAVTKMIERSDLAWEAIENSIQTGASFKMEWYTTDIVSVNPPLRILPKPAECIAGLLTITYIFIILSTQPIEKVSNL